MAELATVAAPGRLARARARIRPFVPVLRVLGYVAAVGLVVWMGVRAAGEVEPGQLDWAPLAASLAGIALWWVLLARGWALIAGGAMRRADVSLWCRTQALRFLPGGIWAPASRVAVVPGTLLERVAMVAGENLFGLGAALTVGGLALGIAGPIWWLGLAPALLVPLVATRMLAGRIPITPATGSRAGVNYGVAFLAYAAAAVLVQVAVSGGVDVLAVAGAAALAWAAGLVVVIAPSGIGVREWAYVGLLAGTLPHGELAAAAVALRLVSIVAELAVLVVAGRPAPTGHAERAESQPAL